MEVYKYKGRTKHGDVMTGVIEAPTQDAVADWLLASGIAPITVRLVPDELENQPRWLKTWQEKRLLGLRDRLMFTRQMATMVRAGVPMIQSLASIQKSTRNIALVRILRTIRSDIEKGMELSRALSHHPNFFDEYYVAMVRVGENSGQLEEIFRRLFAQLEFEAHMQKKVKGALRYPIFVLVAIAIALGVLTVFVIPVFASFFAKFNSQLPFVTKLLLGTSEFAVNYWYVVLGAIAAAYYTFAIYVGQPAGRYKWDKFKLRIPVAGSIIEKATLARFCRSLATASRSGVPLVQAFTLVSKVVNNSFYEQRILHMREGVERGESLLRVAQLAGIFTPLELQMISVGEETGDVDGMLSQVATTYQEDVEYEIEKLSDSIQPILMTAMGVLVLILMLGIFLPMWQLGAAVKGNMGG